MIPNKNNNSNSIDSSIDNRLASRSSSGDYGSNDGSQDEISSTEVTDFMGREEKQPQQQLQQLQQTSVRSDAMKSIQQTWQNRRQSIEAKKQQEREQQQQLQSSKNKVSGVGIKSDSKGTTSSSNKGNDKSQQLARSRQPKQQTQQPQQSQQPLCVLFQKAWDQVLRDQPNQRRISTSTTVVSGKKGKSVPSTSNQEKKKKQTTTSTKPSAAMLKSSMEKKSPSFSSHSTATTASSGTSSSPTTFPSVLSILQANELVRQVESIQKHYSSDDDDDDDDDTKSNKDKKDSGSSFFLSVLPKGYDFKRAVQEMSRRQQRAFWLVDLAAVIRKTVQWKQMANTVATISSSKTTKGQSHQPCKTRLCFLYSIATNPDPILLRIFASHSHMGWIARSKGDLNAWKTHLQLSAKPSTTADDKSSPSAPFLLSRLYDHSSLVIKPDGYIREWLRLQQQRKQEHQSDEKSSSFSSALGIHDHEDLQRILVMAQRFYKRQGPSQEPQEASNPEWLDFVLSLQVQSSAEEWKHQTRAVIETLHSLMSLRSAHDADGTQGSESKNQQAPTSVLGRLVGFSWDIMPYSGTGVEQFYQDEIQSFLKWYFGTLLPSEQRRQAESDPEGNNDAARLGQVTAFRIRVDLTGDNNLGTCEFVDLPSESTPSNTHSSSFSQDMVDWWNQLVVSVQRQEKLSPLSESYGIAEINIHATRPLLADSTALCTRIIGVKETVVTATATDVVIDMDATAGSSKNDNTKNHGQQERRRHYYIDDGCYGSLYQGVMSCNKNNASADSEGMPSEGLRPMPLAKSTVIEQGDKQQDPAEGTETTTPSLIASTVWGPTCDGLDKVCPLLPLPELQRDDWLVFPQTATTTTTSEVSTAFNGFRPPDTAYCVLGYFGN